MNALKAFDASARCGGFTAAANELSVSPGAVSRHVAKLEEYLGEPLFERHHNEIQLTRAGTQYFLRIRSALSVIEDASSRLVEGSNPRVVHVTCLPGLAKDWIVPQLAQFAQAQPRIEIELSTKAAQICELDLQADGIDIAITYEVGDVTGDCELLFESELQVVCSPSLFPTGSASEADLARQTFLYSLNGLTHWRQWIETSGLKSSLPKRHLRFADGSLAVQAAIHGLGIALGESALVAEDLRAGRLISPFRHRVRPGVKFCIATNPRRAASPGVKAFHEWLLERARAHVRFGSDERGRAHLPPLRLLA